MLTQRLIGHARRFKPEFSYGAIIGVILGLFLSMFYPGEEGMKVMIDFVNQVPAFSAIFGGLADSSKGWVLWVSIICNLVLYFLLSVTSIMIGSKLIPTSQEDALELFLGANPFTARKFYLENFLSAVLTLVAVLLPLYLVIAALTVTVHTATAFIGRISLTFAVSLLFGIFYLAFTSMVTVLRFSRRWGKIAGFGYMFYAFVMEIMADIPEYAQYADISINHYLAPTAILFDNFDWQPFFVLLAISFAFFAIGYWRVKVPDFVERVGSSRRYNRNPFVNIGHFVAAPDSGLSRRFPLFMEQTRKDLPAVLLVIVFVLFQQGVIYFTLPAPDALLKALNQSSSPTFDAFSQNHPLRLTILGFLVLKFYSVLWMFYGVVLMFIATGIPTRDVRADTHDLLLANDIKPTRLIFARISSMAMSFTFIVWITFFALRLYVAASPEDINLAFDTQFGVFLVLWIHYLGMAILLVGATMIPTISKGRTIGIAVFIYFVMLSFIPFLEPSIEFLKYSSYLSYFDPVGMVYEEVKLLPSIATSLVLFIGASIFTWFVATKRYVNADFR